LSKHARRIVASFFLTLCCALATVAQDQFGTVYFYRDRDTGNYLQQPGVLNPEVEVDLAWQPFFSISERTFIGFKMAVGRYRLSTKINGKYTYHMLVVKPGGIYYVHIERQTITQDPFTSAMDAIRNCDALKAKKVKINAFEIIRENPTKILSESRPTPPKVGSQDFK
jgi:hypothetical protein